MATSSCARKPILKRTSTAPTTSPSTSSPRLTSTITRGAVHFPPSPTLTRTFSAYSATTYDRSPIVVPPNACALPSRGCPGRTYVDNCNPSRSSLSSSSFNAVKDGRHLHPRACAVQDDGDESESDEERCGDAANRTPTRAPALVPTSYYDQQIPPPLIRDHNVSCESSSSDSDSFSPYFPSISGGSRSPTRGRGRSRSRSRSPSNIPDSPRSTQRNQVKIKVSKDMTHARYRRSEPVIEDESELEVKYKALDSRCSFSFAGSRFNMESDEGCFAGF